MEKGYERFITITYSFETLKRITELQSMGYSYYISGNKITFDLLEVNEITKENKVINNNLKK